MLDAWAAQTTAALRAWALVLAKRDDGRSQVAAAWLLKLSMDGGPGPDDATLAELLVSAGELAPDDPLVAWFEATGCAKTQPVCSDAAVARLQQLDPGNAAAWLVGLDDALSRGDQAAIDKAIERAAGAGGYKDPWQTTGAFFNDMLAQAPLPARSVAVLAAQRRAAGAGADISDTALREISAIAIASATATPGLAALSSSCRRDAAGATAQRLADCLQVFSHLSQSGTLSSRSMGLAFAVRLTDGTPAGAAWAGRQRQYRWFQQGATALFAQPPPGYAQSIWHIGEVATLQALMTAQGLPMTPPPGWQPTGRG